MQRMGQIDDESHVLRLCGVCQNFIDKRLVDFQNADRQPSQVGQGGISRPEVVEGHPYAQGPQAGEFLDTLLHRFDQNVFRHFQLQLPGLDSILQQNVFHLGDKISGRQLPRR